MSLATKNVATVLVGSVIVLALSFAFVTPAKADMLSDLQAQVQALLAQIAALSGNSSSSSSGAGCYAFTMTHKMGDTGGEVMWIQKFLNSHGAMVSASGAGSMGNESSYFGAKTKAAVAKWQAANGVSPAAGLWGPITRAKVAMVCGSTTSNPTNPTTPTGPGLSVMAGSQPANSLAPQGASRVPFTTFSISNNSGAAVTINGITVKRTGLGANAVFSGVVLIDSNGLQVGNAKTLNSNDQATVGDSWTIQPGQTQMFTVAGNMASSLSSYAGQVVTLSVVGINTTAPVNGSLPITGAQQTVNSTLSIGSVSTSSSSYDPGANQTKSIGDQNIKFSGIRFTASSAEDLKLFSVRWRQVGSASSVDLANVMTYINGTAYPTSVDATGKYYTTTIPGGVLITKGNSIDVWIQGDVVGSGSASRTVEFNIDKVTDVYFVGQTYGYGVAPSGTATPWYDTYVVTINAGTATTIGKANEVPAQNVALNVANQPLGGFVTDFKGEAVSVQQMVFTTSTSSTGVGVITNATIVDENGKVVAGPVDGSTANNTFTFTDTVTFPVGRHVYTLKGKLPSGWSNGGTYYLTTVPSSGWTNVTGQTSGNTISLSGQSSFNMNTMTVKAASLQVAVSATPAAQNIVAGGQGVLFANYQFDASQSGEDVRFSSLTLDYDGSDGGFTTALQNLSSCQLFDGAVALNTGSNVRDLSGVTGASATTTAGIDVSVTLDNPVVIAKGTVKELAWKCNVSSSIPSNATAQWGISSTNAGAIAATGVTSSNSVTPTSSTGGNQYGQVMTISSGTVTVSLDASSPSYQIVSGGSSGVTLGVFKFRAANESVNLQRVGLKLTNTASSSASDLVSVTLWANNTQIGTATFVGAGTQATSTLSSPLLLPKDTDVVITVKGAMADVGGSNAGVTGHVVAVDVEANSTTNTQGTGVGSGSTINASGTTAVAGVRLYKSFPVVSDDGATLGSTGIADGKLMRFKITADSKGPVGIAKFTFTIATTTATVTGINVYGFTDSSYSTPISGIGTDGAFLQTANTSWASGTTQLEIGPLTTASASTTVQIPGGATRYFEVRGSVSGATSGASIVTTLVGDNAFAALSGFDGTYLQINNDATARNNFIWSPDTDGTSALTDADWGNGFGVVGLPSGGLVKTRTN